MHRDTKYSLSCRAVRHAYFLEEKYLQTLNEKPLVVKYEVHSH